MINKIEKKDFWDNISYSYPSYPTVRHRKRWIIKMFNKYCRIDEEMFVFDYGCGTGDIIQKIKKLHKLRDNQIGGSDMSEKSIELCKKKIDSPFFYHHLYPRLEKPCDVIICSEVIEHSENYQEILKWIQANLKTGGILLLSTQGGKMHKIDEYSGHVHSFKVDSLIQKLDVVDLTVVFSREWGFPLFTLQKMLTDINFDRIKDSYLEGFPSLTKRIFFNLVYIIYFVEDLINYGPQIFICAKKKEF